MQEEFYESLMLLPQLLLIPLKAVGLITLVVQLSVSSIWEKFLATIVCYYDNDFKIFHCLQFPQFEHMQWLSLQNYFPLCLFDLVSKCFFTIIGLLSIIIDIIFKILTLSWLLEPNSKIVRKLTGILVLLIHISIIVLNQYLFNWEKFTEIFVVSDNILDWLFEIYGNFWSLLSLTDKIFFITGYYGFNAILLGLIAFVIQARAFSNHAFRIELITQNLILVSNPKGQIFAVLFPLNYVYLKIVKIITFPVSYFGFISKCIEAIFILYPFYKVWYLYSFFNSSLFLIQWMVGFSLYYQGVKGG